MFIFLRNVCYNSYTVIYSVGGIEVMFNSTFLKGSSYLVGSSLILNSAQGFGAAAELEDVNNEVKDAVNEGAAPAVSLDVACTSEELNNDEKVVSEENSEDVAVAENVAIPEKAEVELLKELLKTAVLENAALRERIKNLKDDIKSYEYDNRNLNWKLGCARLGGEELSATVRSLLSEREEKDKKKKLVAKIFIFLLIADLVQVFIRGRGEICLNNFAISLGNVVNRYWFLLRIFRGVSVGIEAAWYGENLITEKKSFGHPGENVKNLDYYAI